VRESYGIPRDESVKLRDFPTLRHVIGFVRERAPDTTRDVEAPSTAPAGEPELVGEEAPRAAGLEAADRMPRRVPVPVLRPPAGMCKPTGVLLAEGTRVVVMADEGGVGRALARQLKKLGVQALVVGDAPPADELEERLRGWSADGAITGVYWLPALDAEPDLPELDHPAWKEGLRRRVKLMHAALRALGEQVSGPGTFLVSGTRLGGLHGYGPEGATAPMGGGVTGFTKAFKRERPDALVKAVDLEVGGKQTQQAQALIEETLWDPAAVEVGRRRGDRWSVGLEERPPRGPGLSLGKESVFVITGAAGSIVAAIVADLAAASGGTFHLLDLTPQPDPADPDLSRFAADREGLKIELAERMRSAGERPTPAKVERQLARLERSHAALDAIRAVEASGGHAFYHALDLTDAQAASGVMTEVRERHGRIDALVHAAGVEISRLLPEKETAEFNLVFDVKSDGWFNLLRACGDVPIGATVAFTSVAGRFGNAGQTDYAAANDLLCKQASSLRRTRPETHAIAIDWTAWAGIGMATRGSIPKMMELAGIEMLPPESGIPTVRRELTLSTGGELVVGGAFGRLLDELDPTGGVNPEALATGELPMIGSALGMGIQDGLRVETELDPRQQPFLDHHRIDGTPVLPGVMGIEAFAELARLPLPGHVVTEISDVSFLAPFKFYRDEPRTLLLEATFHPDGDDILARCRLVGTRVLAGRDEPQATTHFQATVRLSRSPAAAPSGDRPGTAAPPGGSIGRDAIYRVYFHGPAYQVLESAWGENGRILGTLSADLPDDHSPAGTPTLANPRLIELCFQTAGVWELGTSGRMALPAHIDQVTLLTGTDSGEGRLQATVTPVDGGFDAAVVDPDGRVHAVVRGYRSTPVPSDIDPKLLAPFRSAVS
jgi:NAD(P)-dependent dehydrogenase (short-subunit alcohol dehydrogenase family)